MTRGTSAAHFYTLYTLYTLYTAKTAPPALRSLCSLRLNNRAEFAASKTRARHICRAHPAARAFSPLRLPPPIRYI